MEVSVNVGQTVINLYTVQGRDIVTYLWPDTFIILYMLHTFLFFPIDATSVIHWSYPLYLFKIQPCFSVQW